MFLELTKKRGLIFKKIDSKDLENKKDKLLDLYREIDFSDVQGMTTNGANLCAKSLEQIKALPAEFTPTKMLEKYILDKLSNVDSRRRIRTSEVVEEDKKIKKEFETCIGLYIAEGKGDIDTRFRQLINGMNKKGYTVNLGRTVSNFGMTLSKEMEKLQADSKRGSREWRTLLEPTLHAYSLSKELQNERYNPKEQKIFEDKLVELGLIERDKELQKDNPIRRKIIKLLKKDNDKDQSKEKVKLLQAVKRDAAICYINTGMPPQGFKILEDGNIVEETELEKIKREQIRRINQERVREAEKEKEENKNMARVCVNGMVLNKPEVKKVELKRDVKEQQKQELER